MSVNTTSAHRRPVFVDCHSRRLEIDRQCTHYLRRNAYCHFELCRDCGLGCFSELLLADTEAVGGGGVLVSNTFLQQNAAALLLELYFNDSMQTVRARRRQWQSRKRSPMGPMG